MDGSGDHEHIKSNVFFSINCPNDKGSTEPYDQRTNTNDIDVRRICSSDNYGIAYVYQNELEALQKLKKCDKASRLKKFESYEEARDYIDEHLEINDNKMKKSDNNSSEKVEQLKPGRMLVAVKTENLTAIRELVAENKRYLVTAGGAPTILQVGFRYNAMHVAAFNGKLASAELIMELLENTPLFEESGGGDGDGGQLSTETIRQSLNILIDLYINSPEKGKCEVPLHFACKFGHVDLVRFFLNHAQIKVDVVNADNESPTDVVCSRRGDNHTKVEILRLFQERYYVPLIRTLDDSEIPQVGVASKNVQTANCIEALTTHVLPRYDGGGGGGDDVFHLKNSMQSLAISSPRGVRAYAGPMDLASADKFRIYWKSLREPNVKLPNMNFQSIKRSDFNKGLERIGREIAHGKGIQWTEYWDFINIFADFGTEQGLLNLESHLESRTIEEIKNEKMVKDKDKENIVELAKINSSFNSNNSSNNSNSNKGNNSSNSIDTMDDLDIRFSMIRLGNNTIEYEDEDSDAYLSACSSQSSYYETASDLSDDIDVDVSIHLPETPVFIMGNTPSKKDIDVLRAVNTSLITPDVYPMINRWHNLITSYTSEARNTWKTPKALSERVSHSQRRYGDDRPHIARKLSLTDDDIQYDASTFSDVKDIESTRVHLNF